MADNERKTFDYGAVLSDLQAKRAALDQAINSLQVAAASGALIAGAGDSLPPMTDSVSVGLYGGEVPVGAFLGKSLPDAAKLCLQIMKRKMTTREISDALLKGGIETTAKTSFPAIVHSILRRTWRSNGSIVKFGNSQWGLPEWLPPSMRASASVPKANTKKKKKVQVSKGPKVIKSENTAKTASAKPTASESIPKKVRDALRDEAELSMQEVAEKVGTRVSVAAMILGGMVKSGSAEKTASGKYRAVKAVAA